MLELLVNLLFIVLGMTGAVVSAVLFPNMTDRFLNYLRGKYNQLFNK